MKRPTLAERNALLTQCWQAVYNARTVTWALTDSLKKGAGPMPERKRFEQLIHEVELLDHEVKVASGIQRRNKTPKLAVLGGGKA
jgi:hypothetical protein